MAQIGSFSYGSASAYWYNTVQELLSQLPDNNSSLIQAADIRDAVYSLWSELSLTTAIATSASVANGGALYSNPSPTPYTVGGITAGSTFVGTFSVQNMFDRLLYPVVGPSLIMNSISDREFGAPLPVSLGWTVSVKTNPISTLFVNGSPQVVPPYSGFVSTSGTYSTPVTLITQTNTFSSVVTDTSSIVSTASVVLNWKHRRYWGVFNFGNVNLTTNPGSASYMASLISDSNVRSMLSGNANGSALNSELSLSKTKTYEAINGGGSHLVFAWPSVFPNSTTPTFFVNGMINNAFTSIKTAYSFSNQYGLQTNYEIWVSNTKYNGPVNIQII